MYNLLGLADLLAGAFTLANAPLVGILFYVASGMASVFRVRGKLA